MFVLKDGENVLKFGVTGKLKRRVFANRNFNEIVFSSLKLRVHRSVVSSQKRTPSKYLRMMFKEENT